MLLDIGGFAFSRHTVSVASRQAATPGDYPNSRDRYICLWRKRVSKASVGRMQSAILLVPLPSRLIRGRDANEVVLPPKCNDNPQRGGLLPPYACYAGAVGLCGQCDFHVYR